MRPLDQLKPFLHYSRNRGVAHVPHASSQVHARCHPLAPNRTPQPAAIGWRSLAGPGRRCQRTGPGERPTATPTGSLLHEWAHCGALSPIRSTTPATTLASRRSPSLGDPHSRTAVMCPTAHDSRQLSTVMTATLSAELDGRVPADLVADIVRTVLDESRPPTIGGPAHDDRGSPASGASDPRRLVPMNQSYGPGRRCELRPKPSSVPPAMGGSRS